MSKFIGSVHVHMSQRPWGLRSSVVHFNMLIVSTKFETAINKRMTYKLYIKTHTKTGLKYLGYTRQNPLTYKGSGKYWKLHLTKHGNDVETEILHETSDKKEINRLGIHYSTLWNIVASPEWANLKEEAGDGGAIPQKPEWNAKRSAALKGRKFSEEHKANLSKANTGRKDTRSPETKAQAAIKASAKLKGRKKPEGFSGAVSKRKLGTKHSEETLHKMKTAWTAERKAAQAERRQIQNENAPLLVCPHCGKQSKNKGNMNRYHFDNCTKCLH